jgi:membrane protease subunit (stomatin/prohibitin family)
MPRRPRDDELTKEESMPFLLRAAVVGGAAYHVGKRAQAGRDQDAAQQQQIDDLQAQQDQQQYQQQAAPAPASSEDGMAKLTQLKSLLDQGVLTQAEFDMQKQKILMSM